MKQILLTGLVFCGFALAQTDTKPTVPATPATAPAEPPASANDKEWLEYFKAKAIYEAQLADMYQKLYNDLYVETHSASGAQVVSDNAKADAFMGQVNAALRAQALANKAKADAKK